MGSVPLQGKEERKGPLWLCPHVSAKQRKQTPPEPSLLTPCSWTCGLHACEDQCLLNKPGRGTAQRSWAQCWGRSPSPAPSVGLPEDLRVPAPQLSRSPYHHPKTPRLVPLGSRRPGPGLLCQALSFSGWGRLRVLTKSQPPQLLTEFHFTSGL